MKCYNYACRKDSDQLIEVGYGGYWLCPPCASVRKHEKEMETLWLNDLEFYAHHFQRMMIPVEGDHPVVRRKKVDGVLYVQQRLEKARGRVVSPEA